MTATLGYARLFLGAEVSEFDRALDDARKKAQSFGQEVTRALDRSTNDAARSGAAGVGNLAKEIRQAEREVLGLNKAGNQLATVFGAAAFVAAARGIYQIGKEAQAARAIVSTLTNDTAQLERRMEGLAARLRYTTDTTTLLRSSYDVLSAGFTKAADAEQVLEASAKGARGGLSDLATVSDATTTILNAYSLSAANATAVVDKMIATQNSGKIIIAQYAQQIGQVASTAAQAGVSLDEMNAFIAVATVKGVQSSSAITGLRQAIASVVKPTDEAAAAAKELGIQFGPEALKAKGLYGVLQDIQRASNAVQDTLSQTAGSGKNLQQRLQELNDSGDASVGTLTRFFGSVEAVAAILPSLGSGANAFKDALKAQQNSAGQADLAYKKVTDQIGVATERTGNLIKEIARVSFNQAAPALSQGLEAINSGLEFAVGNGRAFTAVLVGMTVAITVGTAMAALAGALAAVATAELAAAKAAQQKALTNVQEALAAFMAAAGDIAHTYALRDLLVAQAAADAAERRLNQAMISRGATQGLITIGARGLAAAMAFMTGPIGWITVGLGLATAAMIFWGNSAEDAKQKAQSLADEIEALRGKFDGLSKSRFAVLQVELQAELAISLAQLDKLQQERVTLQGNLRAQGLKPETPRLDQQIQEQQAIVGSLRKAIADSIDVAFSQRNAEQVAKDEALLRTNPVAGATSITARSRNIGAGNSIAEIDGMLNKLNDAFQRVRGSTPGAAAALKSISDEIQRLKGIKTEREKLLEDPEKAKSREAAALKQEKEKALFPLAGQTLASARVTSDFGPRRAPRPGASSFHGGLDIATPVGTDVLAPMDGIVTDVSHNRDGRGNYVEVTVFDKGSYKKLRFMHLSSIKVQRGQKVDRGSILGDSGNTGTSTGPHLHFSVLQGGASPTGAFRAVDPRGFLQGTAKGERTRDGLGALEDELKFQQQIYEQVNRLTQAERTRRDAEIQGQRQLADALTERRRVLAGNNEIARQMVDFDKQAVDAQRQAEDALRKIADRRADLKRQQEAEQTGVIAATGTNYAAEFAALDKQVTQVGKTLEASLGNTAGNRLNFLGQKARELTRSFQDTERSVSNFYRSIGVDSPAARFASEIANITDQSRQLLRTLDEEIRKQQDLATAQPDNLEAKARLNQLTQQRLNIETATTQAIERRNQQLDIELARATANLLRSRGDTYGANAIELATSIAEQDSLYQAQLADLERLREAGKITTEQYDKLRATLEALNRVKLEELKTQFKSLDQEALTAVGGALKTFLGDILSGTQSIGDAFRKMISSILSSVSQLLAQQLFRSLFGGIFPGLAGGGTVGNYSGGGTVRNYAPGGEVASGNFDTMRALAGPIGRALRTEGPNSVLAALTPGEEVLSQRNGEAQLYRRLFPLGLAAYVRSLNNQGLNLSEVYNFSGGGSAAPTTGAALATAPAAEGQGRMPNIVIANITDPKQITEVMSGPEGDRLFMNFIRRNPTAIKRELT